MSDEPANHYPFNGETIFLRSLQFTVRIYLEERKPLPEFLSHGIKLLGQTIKRRAAEIMAMIDSDSMTETQVKTFWDQVFAFAFLSHGMPVPTDEEISAVYEHVDDTGDENEGQERIDEPLYDENPPIAFIRQQRTILEYFAHHVNRFGRYMPVPESVRRKLRGVNRSSQEEEGDGREGEVALCNCPYCWVYMEDLTRFMDHLWERHAVIDGVGERRRSDAEEKEEEVQDRKDSGYSETMPTGGSRQAKIMQPAKAELGITHQPETHADTRKTPGPAPPTSNLNIKFWKGVLEPPLWKDQAQLKVSPATAPPRAAVLQAYRDEEMRAQQVRDHVTPIWWFDPYKKDTVFKSKPKWEHTEEDMDIAQRLWRREDLSRMASESVSMEEKVEVQTPPPTPVLKKRKLPSLVALEPSSSKEMSSSPNNSDGVFKLPTKPASQMRKPMSVSHARPTARDSTKRLSSSSSPSPGPGSDIDDRHWICAHDQGSCGQRFDSLVLYIEHLVTHGYIVYKPSAALRRSVFAGTSRDLRTAWGTSL